MKGVRLYLKHIQFFVHSPFLKYGTPPTAMSSFTFSGWIHPNGALGTANRFFAFNRAHEWDPSLKIGLLADGRLEAYLASTQFTSDAGAVPANEWSHIAVTLQGQTNGKISAFLGQDLMPRWKYQLSYNHWSQASWAQPVFRWVKLSGKCWVLL